MNNHPTPFTWMGRTIYQEHILRYLDRENPHGKIIALSPFGASGLTVTDAYCVDHTYMVKSDGEVICLDDLTEAAV